MVIAAPESLSGKTTIAAAIASRLSEGGTTVALARLAGDAHAAADARFFAGLPFNADPLPADIPSLCSALGDACAGVAVTRVPVRRLEATRDAVGAIGARLLGLIPEDRTLAAPTLGAVAEALEADSSSLNSASETVIDRPIISSISADPAQGYFARYSPNAVIVRGDKPDQQLGALNAGAPCLIVTGGLPVLSYVEERAAGEGIPVLRTPYDTVAAVERLEALYGATPFCGRAKVERIAGLAGELDISALA